jgi:hypothetical protein
LTTEHHRWQPPEPAPLIIFQKRLSGIIKSVTAAAAITSSNYNLQLFFDNYRMTVKKKTATAAAANTSTNRKWIYLLTTERHRWQSPAGAR